MARHTAPELEVPKEPAVVRVKVSETAAYPAAMARAMLANIAIIGTIKIPYAYLTNCAKAVYVGVTAVLTMLIM